jgi:hypothetical protein
MRTPNRTSRKFRTSNLLAFGQTAWENMALANTLDPAEESILGSHPV